MADTQKILSILKNLPNDKLEGLKSLFWEELNYDHANQPIPTGDWDSSLKDNFAELPYLFATGGNGEGFHVIYARLIENKISINTERALINKLTSAHPHCLFVFSNLSQSHWHFVNAVYEKDEKAQRRRVLRRISISAEDRLRTASERISRLDANLAAADLFGIDPYQLQKLHEDAFDVEAVTAEFFKDYKEIFTMLKNDFVLQSDDKVWAHDFALQFLNRLMFLYYIERKRWLGKDPDFLHNFWRAYKRENRPTDTFVSGWLEILFFDAFNKKFAAGASNVEYLPKQFRDALQLTPWLNGGLFEKIN